LQQYSQEQFVMMRLGIGLKIGLMAATLCIAAQPAAANNKDKSKRAEPAASNNTPDACKPAVRSMSESTPVRRSDCARTRRILM
jgi:hypothetical protein